MQPQPAESPRLYQVTAANDKLASVDLLNVRNDIRALAALIAAADTTPPLAVAIAAGGAVGSPPLRPCCARR